MKPQELWIDCLHGCGYLVKLRWFQVPTHNGLVVTLDLDPADATHICPIRLFDPQPDEERI